MPAPILTGPPVALALVADGTAASAAQADPLQFDSLLAAALAGAVQGKADAVAVLEADAALSGGGDQGEGTAPDELVLDLTAATAPLPDSLLSAIVAPPAPMLAAEAVDAVSVDTGRVGVPSLESKAPAGPGLPQAPSAPVFAARAEPAPLQAAPGPRLEPPEPARIAAPAAVSPLASAPDVAASQLAAQLAAPEPGTPADRMPVHAPTAADAAANPAPVASERSDPGVRVSGQPVRLEIAAPLGSREFGADLGNRLVWMATHNHQVAELRIDPPQLGPVELRLSIANDQASLSITSPHAAVRDAIQASLPRLQDMLQGLGINLGSVSVGAEAFGQGRFDHPGQAQHPGESGRAPAVYSVPSPAVTGGIVALPAIGVIDVYA